MSYIINNYFKYIFEHQFFLSLKQGNHNFIIPLGFFFFFYFGKPLNSFCCPINQPRHNPVFQLNGKLKPIISHWKSLNPKFKFLRIWTWHSNLPLCSWLWTLTFSHFLSPVYVLVILKSAFPTHQEVVSLLAWKTYCIVSTIYNHNHDCI